MGELAKLPNIGKTVEEQLNAVGITSYETLKEVGSKAAIEGIKKTALSAETKEELKIFYNAHK